MRKRLATNKQVYQGEGWLILSLTPLSWMFSSSVSRGGVVDSQPPTPSVEDLSKCIKGRGG